MSRRPPKEPGYEVGYGRPPKHTRFRKGQSGNVKGRPPGRKNLATIVENVFNQPVHVTENGRRRKVTAFEAVLMRMMRKALDGEPRASDQLIKLLQMRQAASQNGENAGPDHVFDPAEDRELLEQFAAMARDSRCELTGGSLDEQH